MRILVRVGEPVVHARATARDSSFYLVADGSFWAYEDGGALRRAGTGELIARCANGVYYEAASELPLFYEQ